MFDLMSFAPKESDHPGPLEVEIMTQAWLGALHWAIGEPQVREAFQRDGGSAWSPGLTPLDKMIDQACGAFELYLTEFVPWFNEHVWGNCSGEDADP